MLQWTILIAMVFIIATIVFKVSATARYFIKFAYFIVHSTFWATAFIPLMLIRPGSPRNALIPAWGLRWIEGVYGLKFTIRGKEHIVKDAGTVVLINHQSILDLIVLGEIWPLMEGCRVLSKKEIFYLWPFGLAAYLWGTIFIDRLNPEQSRGTINKTGDFIKDKKNHLLIFPEGTRHGGDKLLPFKKGAFHVAVASHLQLQPVIVSKYYFLNSKNKSFEPGEVIIEFLPAISTSEFEKKDMEQLIDKTYQIMQARYDQINAEMRIKIGKGK